MTSVGLALIGEHFAHAGGGINPAPPRIVKHGIHPATDGEPLQFFAVARVDDDDASAHVAVIATDVQPMLLGIEREGLVPLAHGNGPGCDHLPFFEIDDGDYEHSIITNEDGSISQIGKPAAVADAIAFLASQESHFIQGAALRVDGGRLSRL